MKIVVSAWPGAGGSTLALLLAYVLEYKLILGSQMFRYIGKELALGDTGEGMVQTDALLQEHFAPLYDSFMKQYMIDPRHDNAVYDTDIINFDARSLPEVLAIFLHSSHEARKYRLSTDKRSDDVAVLHEREQQLRESYLRLYKVDFLNIEDLGNYYDLVIDNSDLSIQDELVYMKRYLHSNQNIGILAPNFDTLEEDFWKNGKAWYKSKLRERGDLPSAQTLLHQLRDSQSEQLQKIPKSIRNIIESC